MSISSSIRNKLKTLNAECLVVWLDAVNDNDPSQRLLSNLTTNKVDLSERDADWLQRI